MAANRLAGNPVHLPNLPARISRSAASTGSGGVPLLIRLLMLSATYTLPALSAVTA